MTLRRCVLILASIIVLVGSTATKSQAEARFEAETCLAANSTLSLGAPLTRSKARLKQRLRLTIVAIGSSSTRGVGASSWAATYPEVMQRELMRIRPNLTVEIINAGQNGETIPGQLSRFESDVLPYKPALVIWQLGANDVVMPWGGMPDDLASRIKTGIGKLNAEGADVVLMDMQRTPFITGSSQHRAMLALIERMAKETGSGYFARFSMFERTEAAGIPASAFTSWDGLHNSDAGYDCTGRAIARAIHVALR